MLHAYNLLVSSQILTYYCWCQSCHLKHLSCSQGSYMLRLLQSTLASVQPVTHSTLLLAGVG
jgi:hypothetical protein